MIPPGRDAGRAAGNASRAANGTAASSRFKEVLAESKPPVVQRDVGPTSADQMWESRPDNAGERRRAERQEEYRDRIDRQSDARIQERAGVKARQSLHAEGRPTPPQNEPLPPPPKLEHDPANIETSMVRTSQKDSPEAQSPDAPQNSSKMVKPPVEALGVREDRTPETGHHEDMAPATSSYAPGAKPGAVAINTPGSDSAPAAREIARILASPLPEGGKQEIPTISGGSPTRADSPSAAKATKESELSQEPSKAEAAPTKSSQTSGVSEFERLIRMVRASSGRQSSTRMMLDPPELGKVHVRVVVEGDRIEVGVETENDAARELISDRAAKLKSVLEEHGFVIDRFDVATNQAGLFDSAFPAMQSNPRPHRDEVVGDPQRKHAERSRRTSHGIRETAAVEVRAGGRASNRALDLHV